MLTHTLKGPLPWELKRQPCRHTSHISLNLSSNSNLLPIITDLLYSTNTIYHYKAVTADYRSSVSLCMLLMEYFFNSIFVLCLMTIFQKKGIKLFSKVLSCIDNVDVITVSWCLISNRLLSQPKGRFILVLNIFTTVLSHFHNRFSCEWQITYSLMRSIGCRYCRGSSWIPLGSPELLKARWGFSTLFLFVECCLLLTYLVSYTFFSKVNISTNSWHSLWYS